MRFSQALILSLIFLAPANLQAQVGSEKGMPRQTGVAYPAEWPQGPGPDSIPALSLHGRDARGPPPVPWPSWPCRSTGKMPVALR